MTEKVRVLVADDDKNLRTLLTSELQEEGFDVRETGDGQEALEMLGREDCDVMLLDLNMPGLDGIEVLKRASSLDSHVEVVVLTGNATVNTAVEAMKLGAYDYLTKPFNLEELITIVKKAFEKKRLLSENVMLKARMKIQSTSCEIVTRNKLMLDLLETVKKVAVSDFPALVYGESGTGKELIAGRIHEWSDRADGPLVPINCGAIPENLLESELFGHEKGAFTGAYNRKLGMLEIANRGTLFLDEIAELPLTLQGKLLRVIETGKFFRIGGTREIMVNVRYISATNMELKELVDGGRFRPDLYYRISTLSLHVPPLRQRKEDIPLLVEHFIKATPGFRGKSFTKDAIKLMSEYHWPGNVRELQNVVQRALLLSADDVIGIADLPCDIGSGTPAPRGSLDDIERDHIINVLKETGGHKGKAAEILGIDPKTLYRKLQSYGIGK